MEDDDDFGDLYTDVLQAFPSHHQPASDPPQSLPSPPKQPQPSHHHRPIDLNVQFPDDDSPPKQSIGDSKFAQVTQSVDATRIGDSMDVDGSEDQLLGEDQYLGGTVTTFQSGSTNFERSRVLEDDDNVHLRGELGADRIGGDEKNGIAGKSVEFDDDEGHGDVTFDVEEEVGAGLDEQQLIPGLSSSGLSLIPGVSKVDASLKDEQSGGGDDWDSDSEDDLQIVLNEDPHGRMTMDGGVMVGSDDEDGDPLVIVGDGDGLNHQGMGDTEWGEDGAQAVEGERNDLGDGTKANGGMAVPPKAGYINQGYHSFHAQFKYVRPGTAPIGGPPPIGPPGGAPGQARPPLNIGPIGGRGRGEWRPPGLKNGPMQKPFQPGFGMPPWGNGAMGRGGGLDFTLPSHKTIFEVDIDIFEDKPWKYPGADVSDFFNFGLNEEGWKDYFKQLEQLRLESTMQSRIRVHETVRAEQDYDPDMPPELAAATNVNDGYMKRANAANINSGQIDLTKGSAIRPPLMTGRAIPVESGSGERLPSIDTRPPRMRDLDAIIEIFLQVDDCSLEEPADDNSRDNEESYLEEVDAGQVEPEVADDPSRTYNGREREVVGRRAQSMNSDPDGMADGNETLPKRALVFPDLKGQSSVSPASNHDSPNRERHRRGRRHDSSPQRTASQSSKDKFTEDKREESLENGMDEKQSPPLSSPATDIAANDPSFEQIDAVNNELAVADGSSEIEADERPPHKISPTADSSYSKKKQKASDNHEVGEGDDSKTARSRGNSKVGPVSNRDHHKMRDTYVKDDIVHDGTYNKRHAEEDEQSFRRRERDGRLDIERKRGVVKGMEDSYHYRDWDPNSSHALLMKNEGFDRRNDRDSSVGVRQRRFEDQHGRPLRVDDSRRREFEDEMGSRHWGKSRDDRIDKDEHMLSRRPLENGNWRERDDTLKGRYENFDSNYNKRRKDEEHMRRDYVEKEEMMLGHREIITHRNRERGEDIVDPHRRGGQPRIRENLDDHHHSIRKKDEVLLQRERGEKQRDDRHIIKQSHEGSLSKREREDGRGSLKSGRGADDKLISHSRARDERRGSDKDHQITKDAGRHSIQNKRKDRIEEEGLSQNNRGREDIHPAGNPSSNEERRSRHERFSTRNDPSQNVADNQRVPDKKSKNTSEKNRDSKGLEHSTLSMSKRNQEDRGNQRSETVNTKIARKEREGQETSVHRQASKEHKDNPSLDEEQQDSKRGRSKLERWTSHKDRDFSINSKLKSSSTSKLDKDIDGHNNDESAKSLEGATDNKQTSVVEKDASVIDAGSKPVDDRHLDTVAKLKKRSERFKLPMASEKETITSKKTEGEALPAVETEANAAAHTEIKQERPSRKRRWVSN